MNVNTTQNQDMTAPRKRQDEAVQQRPALAPRCDVYESKDEVLVLADVPGVTQEALRIDVDEERISIEGERDAYDFRRSFLMPEGIDRDKIAAELKNGVLWLRLPKAAAIRPRRITVSAS